MAEPLIGSEAVTAGVTSHNQLRRRYARVFPNVYVNKDAELTPVLRAKAAWLWSRRRAVIAGFSASALYGSKWIDPEQSAELLHDNRNPVPGLRIWGDRVEHDEIQIVCGMAVTSSARTALDLACWYPLLTGSPSVTLQAHWRASVTVEARSRRRGKGEGGGEWRGGRRERRLGR